MQKWKKDSTLYACERDKNNQKILDYKKEYVKEFLESDPVRDWESIDRCIDLFNFFLNTTGIFKNQKNLLNQSNKKITKILDCGTKDGQMVEYLNKEYDVESMGIEIDKRYVEYAKQKGRKVIYGDVCKIKDRAKTNDITFSHHLLGLTPDYIKSMKEMMRVTKKDGYVVTCTDVPGNKRKHYSLIKSVGDIKMMLSKLQKHTVLYMDYWNNLFPSEFVIILKRG